MSIECKCPSCGKQFGFISIILMSKLFPQACSECGASCYREHVFSYVATSVLFSIGLIALIFLVMVSGFAVASQAAELGLLLLSVIYLLEVKFLPVKVYTYDDKEKDKRRSAVNVVLTIVVVLLSVVLYLFSAQE